MKNKNKLLPTTFLLAAIILLPTVYAIGRGPTIDPTVVLYVKLNNNSTIGENSTLAVDSSQYSRNGTIVGTPTFNATRGFFGDGAYMFNGVNQYITFPNTNGSQMMNASLGFTSCGFISFQVLKNNNNMFGKATDVPGAASLTDWGMAGSTTAVTGKIGNGTSQNSITVQATASVDNLTWFCMDYNQTHARGFVNGARTVSTAKAFSGDVTDVRNFVIAFSSNAARFGNITADEIIVWNVSHTDAQIAQIWQDYNGCFNITENYVASANTVFCPGTYYLNDTGGDGVIQAGTSNIIIDGGGAVLIGNNTSNSIGVIVNGFDNVVVRNFTIIGYGLDGIQCTGSQQCTIANNTLRNSSTQIHIKTSSHDATIVNNTINDSGTFGVSLSNSLRFRIDNNLFDNSHNLDFSTNVTNAAKGFVYGDSTASNGIVINNRMQNARGSYARLAGNNNTITVNNMTGIDLDGDNSSSDELSRAYRSLWLDSGTNSTVSYNNINRFQYGIFMTTGAKNWSINNNLIEYTDIGVKLSGKDTYFHDNTITNCTAHFDGYDLGMKVYIANNTRIINNTITLCPTGIWVTESNFTTISGNTISGIPLVNRSQFNASDSYDQLAGIRITPTFKSWITEGDEIPVPSNVSNLSFLNSNNITISGNTLSNYPMLLWTQGSSNVSHDLSSSSYWLVQAAFPAFLYPQSNMYYSNSYNTSIDWTSITPPGAYYTLFRYGYRGKYYLNYSVSRDWQYFVNLNQTLLANQSQGVVMYNQTDTLVYYGSGGVACANIVSCDGTININISALDYAYVLDNYTVNQSNSRNHTPITTSSGTNTRYLTSVLSSTITNVSVTFFVSGASIDSPFITYPDGSVEALTNYTYDGSEMTYFGSVMPGVTTLTLSASTAQVNSICTSGSDGLQELASWLPILGLVIGAAIVFGVVFVINNGGSVNLQFDGRSLGTIAIIFVGTAITISLVTRVLVAALCG